MELEKGLVNFSNAEDYAELIAVYGCIPYSDEEQLRERLGDKFKRSMLGNESRALGFYLRILDKDTFAVKPNFSFLSLVEKRRAEMDEEQVEDLERRYDSFFRADGEKYCNRWLLLNRGELNDYMGSIRVFLDNYVSIVLGEKKKYNTRRN